MMKSQPVLMDRSDDLIFFQEHAVAEEKAGLVTALAAEKGWRMDIGPIDGSTDSASAGVGAMWKPENIKVQVIKLADQHARDMERIGK